jgi:hypothetical protein
VSRNSYSLATSEELKPLLQRDSSWDRLFFWEDRRKAEIPVLPGEDILEQVARDSREVTAGQELTLQIARVHKRLIWFALWSTLSRDRHNKIDRSSFDLELSIAFENALNHKLNRELNRAFAEDLDRDLSRERAIKFDFDFDKTRVPAERREGCR